MRRVVWAASALALTAGGALAGGIERTNQSVGILFEKGRYAELSFGHFAPDVSGTAFGQASGDMAGDWTGVSLAYKQALSDTLDLAIIFDQPIGANVDYPATGTYALRGTTAEVDANAITALLRYKLPSNVSLIGGVRALRTKGVVSIPLSAPLPPITYDMQSSTETDFGYVLGIAWEKPEIAARVALTYNSAITHDFTATETSPLGANRVSGFETEVPQSLNLEFQTGVAADTLLFGSIRWVDWSAFKIAPDDYATVLGGSLVDYKSDVTTYTLGLGRKFNETWSGAVILGYEDPNGDITGNLGPHDGMKSVGLAATYTRDNLKITGGLRYVEIGDATTRIGAEFADNSGWGAGIRIGMSF
ncbi:hypothetical protein CCR83_15460 [Rhodobacter veldkampii DSM 11550]|uniref:Long-chain fatty acid transporter n=1 Tax=Phaeovulum veldkampii DSM 11550 TaxID=1185920 RepID=A0A2T4JM60_9RHOB|nr:hypothetical protein [Phaeovulum veldkampii]MBK5947808.1 hypothetical protein [Phaeovulum veldkampii DSM 11550]PTE18968.1 hypothetical protein C5F46_02080 [Phaeovulum veldkampii DSM 11550]TDQ64706.1 long-subunit fatty acid transport protein [Phaeovulum veldkampii DSM 11550]